jgi:hypothetical protein
MPLHADAPDLGDPVSLPLQAFERDVFSIAMTLTKLQIGFN